jgi:hypothetical protein
MKLVNSSIVYAFYGNAIHSIILNQIIGKKIIPDESTSKIKISNLPYPTIIDLDKGYSIHSVPNKSIIQINYPEEFDINKIESLPDNLTEIASNFKKLSKLDYKAIGINFKVIILSEDYFLSNEALPQTSEILELKFQIKKDDFLIINNLNQFMIKDNDNTIPAIMFDSNFHLELETKDDKEKCIKNALSKRENCFKILKELINGTFSPRSS